MARRNTEISIMVGVDDVVITVTVDVAEICGSLSKTNICEDFRIYDYKNRWKDPDEDRNRHKGTTACNKQLKSVELFNVGTNP